jgi:hypothetical protein
MGLSVTADHFKRIAGGKEVRLLTKLMALGFRR